MDSFFTSLVVTLMWLVVGMPFAIAVIFLLLPGSRKGSMRTERVKTLRNVTEADTRTLFLTRLHAEGFEITSVAGLITAKRKGRPIGEVRSHHDKAMSATVALREMGSDVEVTLAVWMNDFIFYDTGEGLLVDRQMERLINGPGAKPIEPVPNCSYTALCVFYSAAAALFLSALLATGTFTPTQVVLGMVCGVTVAAACCIGIAIKAAVLIRGRREVLTGETYAWLGMIIAAFALVVGVAAISTKYWSPLRQHLEEKSRASTQVAD